LSNLAIARLNDLIPYEYLRENTNPIIVNAFLILISRAS